MKWNSLDSGLQLFFSREVTGRAGEDLVEKQNAEQGVMPVVPEEYLAYGYTNEDRHFVRVFLGKEPPLLTWDDGLDVVKLLMATYQSAEQRKTLNFPPRGLARFVTLGGSLSLKHKKRPWSTACQGRLFGPAWRAKCSHCPKLPSISPHSAEAGIRSRNAPSDLRSSAWIPPSTASW